MNGERLGYSNAEMERRVKLLADFILSDDVDWKVLWRLSKYSGHEFSGFLSVMQGTKPAFLDNEDRVAPLLFSLVPPEMKNVVLTKNYWLADLSAIRRVVCFYRDHFDDFDFKRLDNDQYIKSYLEARDPSMAERGMRDEYIRVGLLLGYPYQSVVGLVRGRVSFEGYGFEFAAQREDRSMFMEYLRTASDKSGMDTLLVRVNKKIAIGFGEMMNTTRESACVIKLSGGDFLEVVGVDKQEREIRRQLVLLDKNTLGKKAAYFFLLDVFAERYGMTICKTGGAYRGKFMGKLIERGSRNMVVYMTFVERVDGFYLDTDTISRPDLEDWMKINVRNR